MKLPAPENWSSKLGVSNSPKELHVDKVEEEEYNPGTSVSLGV